MMDNENLTQSRAPARSRIPAAGLREMSSANTNSRSGILPPGSIASKTSASSQTTRPRSTTQGAETSRTGTTVASGKPHTRTNSYASSTLTRSASTSRTTKTPSTVGSNARPQSALSRPHPSLAGARRPNGHTIVRPATSLDTHYEEDSSVLGKRKGRRPSHFDPPVFTNPADPMFSARTYERVPQDRSGAHLLSTYDREGLSKPDCRELFLRNAMDQLAIGPSSIRALDPKTFAMHESLIPLGLCTPPTPTPIRKPSSPSKHSSKRKLPPVPQFLTKNSTITSFNYSTGAEWDQETREKTMEEFFNAFVSRVSQAGQESFGLKETVELYKSRVNELELSRKDLTEANLALRVEVESMKARIGTAEGALKDAQREHEITMDELNSRQKLEVENVRHDSRKELETLIAQHEDDLCKLKRRFERELDDEKAARLREINQLTSQTALDTQHSKMELDRKDREISSLQNDLQILRQEIERERKSTQALRHNLDTASSNSVTLESSVRALKARIEFLESGREEQSQAFERLNQQMMDALAETNATKDKLRKEETLRRKLHNQVQELKGNIRVFCRVRPSLETEPKTEVAQIQYPDESDESKEINILGPEEKSSLGAITRKNNNFAFDRVFGPSTQNGEVFDEISQLVQSALDGYNVCIFCYGQTGSGKTHTMSSLDGMIPRAVHQIYETATSLEEKGWRYTMEGNFVEVYNENLNDLLGKAEELDKKKHEIRHDMQRGKTTITDITTVRLDSPQMVETILKRAAANRSVAATKANERSSRSHSVFILKLIGENDITGERSEGTLNLVDLAGSERLSHSGATGERLRETQNINRSLSCLGDVISALGQGKDGGHIPYRNSKLTYLLQFSLGGNSKTLMFVMVSPLQAHLAETLTSLKFATKVHNTHIGTAKRQARVRDS
ncbi:putative kinesin family protein (KlpA) [Aspergillus alliaceus]|uniref:putative kinesin family protein (KlpA) n=1 Tax=Petromyces alliaceus TaxID=209559 RepID=UPI0012A66EBB|nr:kinesin-like protein klpA [Aspergillus alliaceus]KAB8238188.1 kinesin-like protein klpA [Aspergillus alliaceus]